MSAPLDPMQDALRVLRDCEWTAPDHRAHLKEKLMNQFASHRKSAGRRRMLIAAGAGLLALSGLGFAAVEYFGWQPTFVREEVNGQIVERELVPDENGLAPVTLKTADGPAYFLIQLAEDDGSGTKAVLDGTQEVEFVPAPESQELQWQKAPSPN